MYITHLTLLTLTILVNIKYLEPEHKSNTVTKGWHWLQHCTQCLLDKNNIISVWNVRIENNCLNLKIKYNIS